MVWVVGTGILCRRFTSVVEMPLLLLAKISTNTLRERGLEAARTPTGNRLAPRPFLADVLHATFNTWSRVVPCLSIQFSLKISQIFLTSFADIQEDFRRMLHLGYILTQSIPVWRSSCVTAADSFVQQLLYRKIRCKAEARNT